MRGQEMPEPMNVLDPACHKFIKNSAFLKLCYEDNAVAHDSKTDFTGRYEVFRFYAYDPDTGAIVIEPYDIIDEEG